MIINRTEGSSPTMELYKGHGGGQLNDVEQKVIQYFDGHRA